MNAQETNSKRILVIKLGALGDVVQALAPMNAIRKHHDNDHITLMTTQAFGEFLNAANVSDEILIDKRPRSLDPIGWLELRRTLRNGEFNRVYDLQTSSRSNRYARLFWPGPYPEWSGIMNDCSHPHTNPMRDDMHTIERQAEQLEAAGIKAVSLPDLAPFVRKISHLNLPSSYCMIVPGGAQHRKDKRWSTARYREVVQRLDQGPVTPVLCGGSEEIELCAQIVQGCQNARNIAGQTSLVELVNIATGAQFALGNDNGPMHIAAAANTKSIVLYSHASDPALCAQRGHDVTLLRRNSLDDLSVEDVLESILGTGGS